MENKLPMPHMALPWDTYEKLMNSVSAIIEIQKDIAEMKEGIIFMRAIIEAHENV